MKKEIGTVQFSSTTVQFKLVCGPGALAKVTDCMTIYRIPVGKLTLMLSFYFNFNINMLANIW